MSAQPNDGGPAFPQAPQEYEAQKSGRKNGLTTITSTSDAIQGMSLRDYFAAKAMQGAYRLHMDGSRNVARDSAALSSEAYEVADAMLAAREAKR